MRSLVMVAALVLLLAGCLGSEEDPLDQEEEESYESTEPEEEPLPPLPQNVSRTIEVTAGFDVPLPEGEEEFCWMPTNACTFEPFTIPGAAQSVTMTAELSWGLDANNLGLFLYEGDQAIDYDSGVATDGTSRTLTTTFDAGGDYFVAVDPHWSGPETAELTITFEWA